jgi:hypothetical protein
VSLTSSKNSNGAAFIIAEKLHMTEDAVIKAYQRGYKHACEHGAYKFSPDGERIGFYDPSPPDPVDFME